MLRVQAIFHITDMVQAMRLQGHSTYPQLSADERYLMALRQTNMAEEHQATQKWVDRQTLALRDAASTELQEYHLSFALREVELDGCYRAPMQGIVAMVGSRYELQLKEARSNW